MGFNQCVTKRKVPMAPIPARVNEDSRATIQLPMQTGQTNRLRLERKIPPTGNNIPLYTVRESMHRHRKT